MVTYPFVKINLGLDVLRKREDGYHDLETLFVPYHDIHDTLEIIEADGYGSTVARLQAAYDPSAGQVVQAVSDDARVMVTVARKEGVDWNPLDDLTVRAYRLLEQDFSLGPVKIFLEKGSPVGAGLGGGSADAAFALRMLSGIFSLNLTDDVLSGYAARLGSDCAFFLYDRPMFGTGRGEILSEYDLPADFHEKYEIKVVVPEGISVSTADAYKGIEPSVPSVPLAERLSMPVEIWKDHITNSFEKTVFRKYPLLQEIKRSLYDTGAVYASMSGSGSAFFAIYPL